MTIADPSLTRRLKLLEQQVAALERSLSQARQATASYVAPRERWLGRVAASPTPAATDDTYLIDLLGATFDATPGQRDLVEHPRGVSVVARTWPARALSAGDEVIVERIRGGLAGDADAGEWWIGAAGGGAAPHRSWYVSQMRARDGYASTHELLIGDPGYYRQYGDDWAATTYQRITCQRTGWYRAVLRATFLDDGANTANRYRACQLYLATNGAMGPDYADIAFAGHYHSRPVDDSGFPLSAPIPQTFECGGARYWREGDYVMAVFVGAYSVAVYGHSLLIEWIGDESPPAA